VQNFAPTDNEAPHLVQYTAAPPVDVPLLFGVLGLRSLKNASARIITITPATAILVLVDQAGVGWSGVVFVLVPVMVGGQQVVGTRLVIVDVKPGYVTVDVEPGYVIVVVLVSVLPSDTTKKVLVVVESGNVVLILVVIVT
jgi:hypothetical protein